MKRILLQNNFASLEYIDTLRDLLIDDLNHVGIDLDFSFCLNEHKKDFSSYNLIMSHPHLEDGCCLPIIRRAHENGVKVVLLYKTSYPHGEAIKEIARTVGIDVIYLGFRHHSDYAEVIKKYLK